MSHEAKNRLTWAFVVGVLISLPFVSWTGNPLFLPLGVAVFLIAEVCDLAWIAHTKRRW